MAFRHENLTVDVAVVGAGGGGAVLGLALARKGIRAVVLEQASGPPTGLRGEILQPNGQHILDELGVLKRLPPDSVNAVRLFHFLRAGGERLCTIDYGTLPPPYNVATVTLPNAAHHAVLEALEEQAPGALRYGCTFRALRRSGQAVVGLEAESVEGPVTVDARVVVGADGAFSKVRAALEIPTRLHRYREAYLIALFDSAREVTEAAYYVGRRTILGIFPAARRRLYAFYMIPADSMEPVKAEGLEALRGEWGRIAPQFREDFANLQDWRQTAYMPTGRVKTATWVADGAALIGDAAHAMNPHASQGRMQAMKDAMVLADVLADSLASRDVSASALKRYERARRPHVDMLQRLADEQVMFWNTGNPAVAFLRDRVFRTLDRNPRLRQQVLMVTAGLRERAPFGWYDRLVAAGILPDVKPNKPAPPRSL